MATSKKVVLHFPKKVLDQPIVYKLIKEYDLTFNILKAHVTPEEEGLLVIELTGEESNYKKGIKYLESIGVTLQPLSKDIVWHKDICTHCSACIGICPTKALYIKDRKTMEVAFDHDKCILCEACLEACPYNAVTLKF